MNNLNELHNQAINLLKELIKTPSFSKMESETASIIELFLLKHNVICHRVGNNVWAKNHYYDTAKPNLLLNSHHDTVLPNAQYTGNPFEPSIENNKLYGLGSNDAGGCLVALMATFLHYYSSTTLPFNIIFAATAEEEISGTNGIELLLKDEYFKSEIGDLNIACGIVGEPTLLQLAIAERGLLVLDGYAEGIAGHAAREEGVNALYKAIKDIQWFSSYQFHEISDVLGAVKMNVTAIETNNKAHNIIPEACHFVIDIRVNEKYTFEQILETIAQNTTSNIRPRSLRIRPSSISLEHPIVTSGLALGCSYYGSPTSSDKALMPFPTLKLGPGNSARSHSANEFIYIDEIRQGINLYIKLIEGIEKL
jgi:acetylornithine deacetylase